MIRTGTMLSAGTILGEDSPGGSVQQYDQTHEAPAEESRGGVLPEALPDYGSNTEAANQLAPSDAESSLLSGSAGLGLDNSWLPSLPGWGESPEDEAKREQEEFMRKRWPPLDDFETGTGGRFDVMLAANCLFVTLKVGYDFVPGDPAHAPAGVSPEELQWSAAEQDAFRADFAQTVAGSWSWKHMLRSTRPLWTLAVAVQVRVLEDDSDPHFRLTVEKLPKDAGDGPASVCDGGSHHAPGDICDPNQPGDGSGTGLLDSRDVDPTRVRNGSQPPVAVWFAPGETSLDSAGETSLASPATSLTANPAWSVELQGHSSRDGSAEKNLDLARARTDSVYDGLLSQGVDQQQILVDNQGEDGASSNADFERRVDVFVLDESPQITAVHEVGHMFGLSDEYLAGGEAPGTRLDPTYRRFLRDNATVPAGGLPQKGPSDSVMSNGMDVENWHYAPFVAALKQITGSNEWTV